MVLEKSGVLSLIRVVDVLTHTEAGPNPPEEMPSISHGFTLADPTGALLLEQSDQRPAKIRFTYQPVAHLGKTQLHKRNSACVCRIREFAETGDAWGEPIFQLCERNLAINVPLQHLSQVTGKHGHASYTQTGVNGSRVAHRDTRAL
jgi:hypothetical protein